MFARTVAVAVLGGLACNTTAESLGRKCEGGDVGACSSLVKMYSYGERSGPARDLGDLPPIDPVKALHFAEVGCGFGHPDSCGHLGWAYKYGEGSAEDKAKSLASYGRGCELGHGKSCGDGGLDRIDQGDPQGARPVLERGCTALSDSLSCYALANRFPATTDTKVALYQRACELDQEDGSGCWAAGALLAASPDGLEKALPLLKTACARMGVSSRACVDARTVEGGRVLAAQKICGTTPEGETICWLQEPGNPWGMPL